MTKPFARQGHFTTVDNAVFDEIMPELSGSEWKILCFIIRKTIGWKKESDEIAYSQFRDGAGIKSNTTVQKAINGLLDKGLVLVGKTDSMTDAHHYKLNTDYEVRVTETVKRPVTFSVKRPVTETVNTKESIKEKNIKKKDQAAFAAPPPPPEKITNGKSKPQDALKADVSSSGSAPRGKKEPSQHSLLMAAYQDALGYPIPNGAKEAVAAKWILTHGYTVQQAIDCYHHMKRDPFWRDKPISLQSVKSQLGEYVKLQNGNGRTDCVNDVWQSIKIALGKPGKPDISDRALQAVGMVPGGWRRFKEQDVRFIDQLKPIFEEAYERTKQQQPATA